MKHKSENHFGFSIDPEKIYRFIHIAKSKRSFPINVHAPVEEILTHLNLYSNGRIANAALLLFGIAPQRFFITSEVKCAYFHGTDIIKPIPSYQIYKGDVFQLVNQAVDFVLSKVDLTVGTRNTKNDVDVEYELPRAAVTEAIVNAVAHRDYTSNASIQVMLFKDRLEIWNPGSLPYGLTAAKLRQPHSSIPANPLLAEPMYLAGFIERMGTGTRDIIRLCKYANLPEPEFIQEDIFRTVIWRKTTTGQVTGEATGEVTGEVKKLIMVLSGEMKRAELQNSLSIRHDDYFRLNYILPALESGCIEMTHPGNANHPNQKYRLTEKGNKIKLAMKDKQ